MKTIFLALLLSTAAQADPDALAMSIGCGYVAGITSEALRKNIGGPPWLPYAIGAATPVAVGLLWQRTAFQIGGPVHPIDWSQVEVYAIGAATGVLWDWALVRAGVLK